MSSPGCNGSSASNVIASIAADWLLGNNVSDDVQHNGSIPAPSIDLGREPILAHTWDQVCVVYRAGVWPITDDLKAQIIEGYEDLDPKAFHNYTTTQFQYVFPFEASYFPADPYDYFLWITNYWTMSLYASVLYAAAIFGIQRWMRDRKPYDLRYPLFIWNLTLAVFSIIGTHRSMSELYHVLKEHGFEHSVCVASYAFCNKVTAVWVWFFANSKLLELGDTIFIVLRKQRLMFLHWYHHITVMIYTWYSMSTFTAQGRWFVACNLAVHSAMYSYYALRAMKVHIPRNVAMAVTSSQLLQMLVGIYINWSAYSLKTSGTPCAVPYENIFASFLMYMSYFLLFFKFFIDAYFNKSSMIHKPKSKALNEPEEDDLKKMVANGQSNGLVQELRQRRAPAQAAH